MDTHSPVRVNQLNYGIVNQRKGFGKTLQRVNIYNIRIYEQYKYSIFLHLLQQKAPLFRCYKKGISGVDLAVSHSYPQANVKPVHLEAFWCIAQT
jgi:hypothetical protein